MVEYILHDNLKPAVIYTVIYTEQYNIGQQNSIIKLATSVVLNADEEW